MIKNDKKNLIDDKKRAHSEYNLHAIKLREIK